jgi:hypothetical protein
MPATADGMISVGHAPGLGVTPILESFGAPILTLSG